MRLGKVGLQADGGVVSGGGLIQPAQNLEDIAAV